VAESFVDRTAAEIACLQCFYTSDYESHRRRNPDRVAGTCEWFLRHPRYLTWRQKGESAFLWVSADPGCGKSVLASFLVQELSNTESQETLPGNVCFFFFKNDNSEQRTAVHALCAILHQLFVAHPTLVSHAMLDFEKKGSKLTEEFDSMWSIFIAATTSAESKTFICVLDGLDECEDLTRNMLVESLVKLYSKPVEQHNQSSLKIIATSRPYIAISESFRALPEIRLKMEDEIDNSEDIELVVKARLRTFAFKRPYLDSKRINAIESNLITRADRTFLWVSLVLGMLEKTIEGSEQEFTDIIQNLSNDLEAVFEEILRRSPNPEKAKKILHVTVGSTRPLTLTEMNIALAIRLEDESLDDLAPRMLPAPADPIKEICGLFVRVIDSKIYLIHETAREFLISGPESVSGVSGLWNHSLHPTESNLILATICIAYLNFRIFKDCPLVLDHDQSYAEQRRVLRRYTKKHGLLEYAARNCAVHFRNSNEDEALRAPWKRLFRIGSRRFDTWYQVYRDWQHKSPEWPTSVILGSYFGLPKLVQSELNQGRAINQRDASGMTALHWAIEGAQTSLVRLLLNGGADKAAIDADIETALHKAAKKGEDAIVRLLLHHGAEIDARDHDNCTPLHFAAANGHEAIVKTLIEHGSDIYATDDECRGTLHHAANSRNPKILEVLLDLGVELEHMSERNFSVLHEAVMSDCCSWDGENMVQLLLKRGANAKTQDANGETPLHLATLYGRDQVARLLLLYGANLNATDINEHTALHTAARSGQLVMVPLLVHMGADVKAMSKSGTPLHLSAMGRRDFIGLGHNSCKHEAVAQFLLQNGAEVDSRDDTGITPLMYAAKAGHVAPIQLLIEAKANIDIQDNNGNAPLHWAAADGQEEAVQLLILRGAKLNVIDAAGKSTLHWAVEGGFTAVVKLLLATNGIDPDLKDAQDMAPLSYAAAAGHEAIVKLLLATNKVDSDTMSICGQTPLSWAAEGGHKEVVELLLATGKVDPDAFDEDGRTPLSWAAVGGHKAIVELLLASDQVNPDSKDDSGMTALSLAETGGHNAVASLLRSRMKSYTRRRSNRLKRHRSSEKG
jgi:ankyrin repeat domain-containing protein 50